MSNSAKVRLAVSSTAVPELHIQTKSQLFADVMSLSETQQEMLRRAVVPHTGSSLEPGLPWRYPRASVSSPLGDRPRLAEYVFDISETSQERELVRQAAEQGQIVAMWINEGVRVPIQIDERTRQSWLSALENTVGVSAADWREEMAELAWRESPSWRPDVPRPTRRKVRSVAPSERAVPFFSPRAGKVPTARRPQVGGIRLPPGQAVGQSVHYYWAADGPHPDNGETAQSLAREFSRTGLWPLLWHFGEDPASYMSGGGDAAAVELTDPEQELSRLWARRAAESPDLPLQPFPGLAAGTSEPRVSIDDEIFPPSAAQSRLLVVPCNRPADAINLTGGLTVELAPDILSAVLRSWEERFAAIPVLVEPSLIELHVGIPPDDISQARKLAIEQEALCPTSEGPSEDLVGATRWVLRWTD